MRAPGDASDTQQQTGRDAGAQHRGNRCASADTAALLCIKGLGRQQG
jgi:hypothetical protein